MCGTVNFVQIPVRNLATQRVNEQSSRISVLPTLLQQSHLVFYLQFLKTQNVSVQAFVSWFVASVLCDPYPEQ